MTWVRHHVVLLTLTLLLGSAGGVLAASPTPSSSAYAPSEGAVRSGRAGRNNFVSRLSRQLSLNAEQQDAVQGLLASQRQQMAEVRSQTDAKIRAMLNPEQQVKFDNLQAKRKIRNNRR